jgi:hypothetical protein
MKPALSFYFLIFSILFSACDTKNESDNSKAKSIVIFNKSFSKKIIEKIPLRIRKEAVDKATEKIKTQHSNRFFTLAKTMNKKQNTTIKSNFDTQESESQNSILLDKWKNTYSQDKKWMELYESSRTYFLNGWNSEFERNPDASISKEELLLAYRKRMENIFYETPSFIEFCVQEMKVSVEFELFCQKWKENVR